jgi:hypothetical protein
MVLTDDSCPVCRDVKETLAPAVKAGKITIVKDGSRKAKEILKSGVKIKYVPECVTEVSPGKFVKCDIEKLVKQAEEGKL